MRLAIITAGLGLAALVTACAVQPQADGKALFHDYCAGCHGETGVGNGPAAMGLARKPANLTLIAAKNGGVFPRIHVMSWIDGFTRAGKHGGQVMPVFDPLLTGPDVLIDTGGGVMTPTPIQLVALSDYVETLQKK